MSDDRETPADRLFTGVENSKYDECDHESILIPEDRPRGILSPTDREYLCGLKEYAQPQTDANRRQAIRDRVVNGLKDFVLLNLSLDSEEREKIFEELGPEETDDVLASMVAFAYLGVDGDRPRLETCIKHGVIQGANFGQFEPSTGRATDADISISIEYDPDIEQLYQRLERGQELTDAEIGALVRAGKVSPEDVDKLAEPSDSFPGVFDGSESNQYS